MNFGFRSLTRTAIVASAILVSACGSDDPDPILPPSNPAPSGLAAAATGQTTINVTWAAPATAATQFVLQRASGNGSFAEIGRPSGSLTGFTDGGLTAATTYRYRLAAVRNGATSDFSAEASATTQDAPVQPDNPAPAGLAATAAGQTTINLAWTAVTIPAAEIIVQRATSQGAFAEVGRTLGTATTFASTGLMAGTNYRFRLAAVRAGVASAFSSEASATTASASGLVEVTADITTNTTWTSNNVYRLKGFRKVANGATLTIQAGTRIEGDFDVVGSSLFVLRGARIVANGTAQAPIVFTSSRAAGSRQPGDWGGLIIIGNARINRSGVVNIEGTGTSADNPLINYAGGDNDFDNSGSLTYVRVEFAGFGPAQDAELNSFTFAAVGSQTQMSYLQALAGLDDHYEWFGGSADAKYLVSYEAGDDHFDASEGFRGRVQYMIGLQTKLLAPRPGAGNVSSDPQGIENDGCGSNAGGGCDLGFNSTPLTIPIFANFTLVGTGPGVVGSGGGYGMVLRRGVGGHYVNGILARWPNAGIGYRDAASKARENGGVLSLKGIFIAQTTNAFQAGQQTYAGPAGDIEHAPATTAASLFTALAADPNSAADLDWSLAAGVAPRTGGLTVFAGDLANRAGAAVTATAFRGAADPNGAKWWQGWTTYADN